MGEVYLGEHEQLQRKAALKFLATDLNANSDHLERFLREARAASALNHPNICTIYEINSQGETPFIAMEFIEGETVSSMIRRRRRNVRQTIDIAAQVSAALSEAHAAGIVHRDIKPANIIVTKRDQAKILDFGLVKLVETEGVSVGSNQFLTKAGMIVGTASYMSPEQARGLDVDGRTDIWSLGVVLYEMLTGSLPFTGETSTDTLAAILTTTPVPPSQLFAEIPLELERIILKSLESKRDSRYASATELFKDLRSLSRKLEFEAEFQGSGQARTAEDNTFIFDNAPTEVVVRKTVGEDTVSTGRRTNNLRSYFAPIIGRQDEISAVTQLLRDERIRLVTLTGIGGTGKTRLAHAVAETMVPEFEDGVFMIELSSVSLPELLPDSIAQPLGVKDAGGRPVIDILKDHLSDKRMLLVLDNFEQIVDAAAVIAELLVAADGLKVLVTSRFLLHITAEREFVVPPLSPPSGELLSSFETIRQNDAVQLFAERAQAVDPEFKLTEENGRSVAEICGRLEGLPLAIELAAARTRILSPAAIMTKLDSRLRFLTGGARDLPERQRTMHGAIDWTYELLDEIEKGVFRRLSVFSGSFTVEAAEAVNGWLSSDGYVAVVDAVTSLLDKSLLIRVVGQGDERRFGMLEVVREYACEALRSAGEDEAAMRAHAEYFVSLGERAEPFLQAAQSAEWLDRLEDEHDNLRAAMQWSLHGDPAIAVRIAVSVRNFWLLHSHLSEGYKWLKAALEHGGDPPAALRFKLMNGLGLAARFRGDYETARKAYLDGLAAGKEAGDKQGVALSSRGLGLVAMQQGDTAAAREFFESGLAISRELEDKFGVAISLSFLGDLARTEKDFKRARPLFEESLALFRELDNKSAVSDALNNLAAACFGDGDLMRSKQHFAEAANFAFDLGNKMTISYSLDGFAALAVDNGDLKRAAQLCGAAEGLRDSIGYKIEPAEGVFRNAYLEKLRDRLGSVEFDKQFKKGHTALPEKAIALAFEETSAIISENSRSEMQDPGISSPDPANSNTEEPGANSIAVLPFTHLSSTPDDEYFCDGLSEELINALAKIEDLKVAARTSAFSFKGKSVNVSQIGRTLNVKNILEGSVRKSGDRLRITVQLVNASDGYHVWSERYDREMKDIFDVQDEITIAVVDALKLKLLGTSEDKVLAALVDDLKHYTTDVEAYQLYLQGRFFLNKFTTENSYKSIEYFDRAIAVDPNYALAYVGLADAYIMLTEMGPLAPSEAMPKAKEMALKALSLDADLAEAHSSLAMVLQDYEYDFAAAEREFRRAIELNSNSPIARQSYGILLTELERHDEAEIQFKKALAVDPLSVVGNWIHSFCLFLSRRYDEAIARAQHTLELDPNFGVAHLTLAFAYQMKGAHKRSVESYARCSEVMGFPENADYVRKSFDGGRTGFLRSMTKSNANRPMTFSSYIVAVFFATLDDAENAFAELEASFAKRESHIVMLKADPRFDGLRNDPRFTELLTKIGF